MIKSIQKYTVTSVKSLLQIEMVEIIGRITGRLMAITMKNLMAMVVDQAAKAENLPMVVTSTSTMMILGNLWDITSKVLI